MSEGRSVSVMPQDQATTAVFARSVVVTGVEVSEVMDVQEREVPLPAPGHVRVHVSAGGVNFIDIYQRNGTHDMQFPFVAGLEGAGMIEAVGADVDHLQAGDRVAWAMGPGSGYSTHALIDGKSVVPIPEGVTDEEAAAVMLQGLTAHYLGTSTYPVSAGETVLVHAGAGGVGLR